MQCEELRLRLGFKVVRKKKKKRSQGEGEESQVGLVEGNKKKQRE